MLFFLSLHFDKTKEVMKRFSLFAIFLFWGTIFISYSQNTEYPKVMKNGVEYYEYIVRQSEGLWAISQRFGVSQAEIHKHNPEIKDNNGLKVGQLLMIPIKKKVEKVASNEKERTSFQEHVVERKQTLYAISKLYDISVEELISCNNLKGCRLSCL